MAESGPHPTSIEKPSISYTSVSEPLKVVTLIENSCLPLKEPSTRLNLPYDEKIKSLIGGTVLNVCKQAGSLLLMYAYPEANTVSTDEPCGGKKNFFVLATCSLTLAIQLGADCVLCETSTSADV